jgi:hypothetical protein
VTTAKKDTPGSGTSTDTSGKAATDQKSDRKDSGQKGAAEDKVRKQQIKEGWRRRLSTLRRPVRRSPVIVSPVQDRPVFVGDEHRDETHDPGFEPAADGTLPQHEAFDFDYAAKGKRSSTSLSLRRRACWCLRSTAPTTTFDAQLAGRFGGLCRRRTTSTCKQIT